MAKIVVKLYFFMNNLLPVNISKQPEVLFYYLLHFSHHQLLLEQEHHHFFDLLVFVHLIRKHLIVAINLRLLQILDELFCVLEVVV